MHWASVTLADQRIKRWTSKIGQSSTLPMRQAKKLLQPVSFRRMFERVEAKDEDAADRRDVLQILYMIHGTSEFTRESVLKDIEAQPRTDDGPGIAELRRFCTAAAPRPPPRRQSVLPCRPS